MQCAYKASYPPGEAREDWKILKDIANKMKKPLGYNSVEQLKDLIKKQIKFKLNNTNTITKKINFIDDKIFIKPIDYYYTNPIARSSKVMNECRQISKKYSFTGIEKAS